MSALAINLLPQDVLVAQEHRAKLSLLNKISVGVLVLLTFFTSATVALRIAQRSDLTQTQNDLVYAQDKVVSFKDKEEQLVILKQRLAVMQSLIGLDSKKKALFNLILYLTPADMQATDITIDSKGIISLSVNTGNLASVENFITSLGSKDKNSDLIAKIDLESFSSGRNGVYYLTLNITPK